MGKKSKPVQAPNDNPLEGLKNYMEGHQNDSLFARESGKETTWCFFLHDGREVIGQIKKNEPFEIDLFTKEGALERIHKVNMDFLCPEAVREEVLRQTKKDETVVKKAQGPHFLPRFRNHIKNKSLFPLMNRREVLFFTLLHGELLRGIVSGFSRYEINLSMKRGVPVVILRHAVFDVRDKKERSYLKKAVEETGEYW